MLHAQRAVELIALDLGVKIRETFEHGAIEAIEDGRSPSERFELPNVRVTIEIVD